MPTGVSPVPYAHGLTPTSPHPPAPGGRIGGCGAGGGAAHLGELADTARLHHLGHDAHRPVRTELRRTGPAGCDAVPAHVGQCRQPRAGDPVATRLRRDEAERGRGRCPARRPRLRRAHLDGAGVRVERRPHPPQQPGLRGARRTAAARLARRAPGHTYRRPGGPESRGGRRLVRRGARPAPRRVRRPR